MDLDKSGPSDWFTKPDDIDISRFKGMPVYISSVKYGRMVMFAIESKSTAEEVKAAFQLAISSPVHDARLRANATYKKVNSNSKITATVIGGSGSKAANIISGLSGVVAYIKEGGDYSKASPGAPLAYTMRSLYNNEVVKSILASEYQIRNCQQNTGRYRLNFIRIHTIHFEGGETDDLEIEVDLAIKVTTPLKIPLRGTKTPYFKIENTYHTHQHKNIPARPTSYHKYDIEKRSPILAFPTSSKEAKVTIYPQVYDLDSYDPKGVHQMIYEKNI